MKIDQEKLEEMNTLRKKIGKQIEETGDANEEDQQQLTALMEETGYAEEAGSLDDLDM